jgi:hypothetical protein
MCYGDMFDWLQTVGARKRLPAPYAEPFSMFPRTLPKETRAGNIGPPSGNIGSYLGKIGPSSGQIGSYSVTTPSAKESTSTATTPSYEKLMLGCTPATIPTTHLIQSSGFESSGFEDQDQPQGGDVTKWLTPDQLEEVLSGEILF